MICRAPLLVMSHEFHIHVGCTVSICDEAMLYQPFRNFRTKSGGDGGQLRLQSLTHTQSRLRSNFNKTSVKHDCHVIWHFSPKKSLFSETEKCYCFSMFINHTCMPPSNVFNFVFQKLFVHNFNNEG